MGAAEDFQEIASAVKLAVDHIICKGCDDIFKPPVFSCSLEHEIIKANEEDFRKLATQEAIAFIKTANLEGKRIGRVRTTLIVKDVSSYRQVAWLDPFDSVKYLAVCILLFRKIEAARIPKCEGFVHSHRISDSQDSLFDENYGYDSFRAKSGELSRARKGEWKVIADISNFFDRIGNHSLENHLLDIGCEVAYVTLLREMLFFWSGDRRSFGVPVGSDASRIISEAVLIDVDRKLKESGITFVRYVDDYRLFAKTRAEAYRALQILTTLLADEGLSINGRKTHIYQILTDEELGLEADSIKNLSHETIDLQEKVEVVIRRTVSGRTGYSKYYKEPGKEAVARIKLLNKVSLIEGLSDVHPSQEEDHIKLLVKYFIYAEQDLSILINLLDKKITTIFYICDALIKEVDKIALDKRLEISSFLSDYIDWKNCAYPYQIPVIKLLSTPQYMNMSLACHVFDSHKYVDNNIFFREVVSLASFGLDRARVRELSLSIYPTMPAFVQRAIYNAVQKHQGLSEAEKRPLLKNMRQSVDDWFITRL